MAASRLRALLVREVYGVWFAPSATDATAREPARRLSPAFPLTDPPDAAVQDPRTWASAMPHPPALALGEGLAEAGLGVALALAPSSRCACNALVTASDSDFCALP